MLAELGYDPGPADGLMGRRTASAIRAFENDRGLPVTGAVSERLLAALAEATRNRVVQPERRRFSQPSFDCNLARTQTELAICGSHDLAELDRALATNYSDALSRQDARDRALLQAEQRNWITQRDACGADVACLVRWMSARSQELAVLGHANETVAEIPVLPIPTPAPETGNSTAGVAALPAFDLGSEGKDRSAPILLAYQGKTRVPFQWLPHDEVKRYRAALAAIVYGQVAGTDLEEYFLRTRALSMEDAVDALASAGIELTPLLKNFLANGTARVFDGILNAVQFGDGVNQFQKERLKTALREKARASLAAEAGDDSREATVICAIEVLPYDFSTGMFPFDKDEVEHCFAGRPNAIGTAAGYPVSFGIAGDLRPQGFPIGAAEAEALVERIGGPHFVLAIPSRITGRVQPQQSGQPTLNFTAEPTGAMEVRTGAELMDVFYRFPAEGLRDANDTPEARRLADFDRAWWINTREEASVVVGRAKPAALDALATETLFDERTGFSLAVQLNYGMGMEASDRSLASFLDQRSDLETREIAAALGLPEGNLHVVQLSPGLNGGLDRIILVLPQPARAYAIKESLPAYAPENDDYPAAHLRVAVTAERLVRLSGGQERLVMAGQPERLVVRRASIRLGYDASPEIASVAFSPIEAQKFETVRLAWKSDLIVSAAGLLGVEPGEILLRQLESEASGYARNDAFARRDAAISLEREALARSDGRNLHWIQARIGLAPYDFDSGAWLVQSLSPQMDPDAPPADRSLRIELMQPRVAGSYKSLLLPMAQDAARAFQAASRSFPDFDALLVVRISDVDTTYGTDFGSAISLIYEPVEIILFDAGQAGTAIDPGLLRYRHVFASPPPVPDAATPETAGTLTAKGIPGGTFPVLGVALGDDFDASVDQLARKIGAERRLYARTEMRQAALEGAGAGTIADWEPYHNAVLLESSGNGDMVAVYSEPPAEASTVTAIVRTKLFGPEAGPSWPALRDNLLKAYPQVDAADLQALDNPGSVVIWDMPRHRPAEPVDVMAGGCQRRVNAAAAVSVTQLYSYRRARAQGNLPVFDPRATWADAEGIETVPSLSSPLSMPQLIAESAACPPHEVMVLIILYGDDGRVVEYRQAVTMPAHVAAIAERRKAQAAEAATADFEL